MNLAFWRSKSPGAESAPRRRGIARAISGMFKASIVDKKDNWGGTPVGPDAYISMRQPILVARSREQWSNNDYVRGFIRLIRQNVVGPHGIVISAQAKKSNGKFDKDLNDAIDTAWKDWCKVGNADVTGRLSWRALQCMAAETAGRDGEFIFVMVEGDEAGKYGFALQVIDPQRLPVNYDNAKAVNGNFIKQGIEFNAYGRPVAYHFGSMDESDQAYYSVGGKGYVRIEAARVIHGFITELAAQRRGLPWTSTSLFRLHHMQGFEDASVQNARAGSSQMGFIEYDEGFGPEADDDDDVAATINAGPLAFHELPEGAHLKEFKPNYPNGEFAPFIKKELQGAATGLGVPYTNLANDLEGVNFSSIRSGELDAREHYKEIQQWLIETLCERVRAEWLKIALLKGLIPAKNGLPVSPLKLAYASPAHFQPRRWAWVDPKSDVTANVTAIRAGLTSPSQVIREQGRDPNQVFAELADDYKQMQAAGIPTDLISVMFGLLPAPEAAPSKADESVAKAPAA